MNLYYILHITTQKSILNYMENINKTKSYYLFYTDNTLLHPTIYSVYLILGHVSCDVNLYYVTHFHNKRVCKWAISSLNNR